MQTMKELDKLKCATCKRSFFFCFEIALQKDMLALYSYISFFCFHDKMIVFKRHGDDASVGAGVASASCLRSVSGNTRTITNF